MTTAKDNKFSNLAVSNNLVVGQEITTAVIRALDVIVERNLILSNTANITTEIINNSVINNIVKNNIINNPTNGGGTIPTTFDVLNATTLNAGTVNSTTENATTVNAGTINTTTENATTLNAFTVNATSINGAILKLGFTPIVSTSLAGRTYTIADPGTDASFVMNQGNQTINGAITFGTSILLPTPLGFPSPLTYYETTVVTLGFVSNLFGGTANTNVNVTRIGNTVTVLFQALTANVTGSADTLRATGFPTRFCPAVSLGFIPAFMAFNTTNPFGAFMVTTSGNVSTSQQGNLGPTCGFPAFSTSWNVA